MKLVLEVLPHQVTLVPDPPGVLTSNAGWNTIEQHAFLQPIIAKLKALGCRVSIFLDPIPDMVPAAAACGADRIELYTESYAKQFHSNRDLAIADYISTANKAMQEGLGII